MQKIICEIANNGGVILITDLDDGTTPNRFAAFTTTSEAKSAFGSILDGLTATGSAPETPAPVASAEPAPDAQPETPAPEAPAQS